MRYFKRGIMTPRQVVRIAGGCMLLGFVLADGAFFWLGAFMLAVLVLTRNTLP